jgi:hypothetical protein
VAGINAIANTYLHLTNATVRARNSRDLFFPFPH